MELNKYVTLVTFIPWVIIYIITKINSLNNKNYRSFSWNYFKKNIFKIFRLDTLLLIIAFFYFASFNKQFVDKYLFAVMCLYLCVNSFYEKKDALKKKFFKNNVLELFLLFVIMLIPFFVYFGMNKLVLTYKLMLVFLFLEYFIILVVSYVSIFIRNLFKRN